MPMTSPRATGLPGWATTYQEIEVEAARELTGIELPGRQGAITAYLVET